MQPPDPESGGIDRGESFSAGLETGIHFGVDEANWKRL